MSRPTKLFVITKDVPMALRVRAIDEDVALRKVDKTFAKLWNALDFLSGPVGDGSIELSVGWAYDDIDIQVEDA